VISIEEYIKLSDKITAAKTPAKVRAVKLPDADPNDDRLSDLYEMQEMRAMALENESN